MCPRLRRSRGGGIRAWPAPSATTCYAALRLWSLSPHLCLGQRWGSVAWPLGLCSKPITSLGPPLHGGPGALKRRVPQVRGRAALVLNDGTHHLYPTTTLLQSKQLSNCCAANFNFSPQLLPITALCFFSTKKTVKTILSILFYLLNC